MRHRNFKKIIQLRTQQFCGAYFLYALYKYFYGARFFKCVTEFISVYKSISTDGPQILVGRGAGTAVCGAPALHPLFGGDVPVEML
jgi:hypothetical protein